MSVSEQEPSQNARRKRTSKKIYVDQTKVGRGVFAGKRLGTELVIGEVTGTIFDEESYGSDYCLDMGDGRCMEPDAPFRFLNHSCEPNAEVVWHETRRKGAPPKRRLWLMTLRSIAPGEEITIDYSWPADVAIPCRCGAASCRGWIVAVDQRHLLPLDPAPA